MENRRESALGRSSLSALIVMLCTFLSRLLGFLRIAVISAVFGARGTADVINLTFSIPNNLRKLMAEGALSSAFIPVLSSSLVKRNHNREARRITANILTFQALILIPLCLVSIFFAEPLIRTVLSEFRDPDKIETSVRLFRFFINYLLFISISAVMMAVINSHERFLIPAITPILFSISVIVSIVALHETLGVFSMAVGVLLGGIAQIVFQTPLFLRLGYTFRLNFRFRNPPFRRILRQWLPVLATSSIFTITQTVAFRFASGLEEGSTTALTNAIVFYQLPFGIFSASITTVLFPRMSRQVAAGRKRDAGETMLYGLRSLFILLIPSAVVLSILGKEIIAVAIQRGEFTADNTMMTFPVLRAYAAGLFFIGAYNFIQRYFYARQNYRIPFLATLVVGCADVVLSLWLKETPLRVNGLAWANTISFAAGSGLLFYMAYRDLGKLDLAALAITLGKTAAAMVPVIIFLRVFLGATGSWWMAGSTWTGLGWLLAAAAGTIVITLGLYRLLRIEMLDVILRRKRLDEDGKV